MASKVDIYALKAAHPDWTGAGDPRPRAAISAYQTRLFGLEASLFPVRLNPSSPYAGIDEEIVEVESRKAEMSACSDEQRKKELADMVCSKGSAYSMLLVQEAQQGKPACSSHCCYCCSVYPPFCFPLFDCMFNSTPDTCRLLFSSLLGFSNAVNSCDVDPSVPDMAAVERKIAVNSALVANAPEKDRNAHFTNLIRSRREQMNALIAQQTQQGKSTLLCSLYLSLLVSHVILTPTPI
jgi:hypothetical protein